MAKRATPAPILVIGELNVDLLATGLATPPVLGQEIIAADFQVALGSASAIFACGAARLGHPVTFASKVGDDDFGRFCLAQLKARGVKARVKVDRKSATGVTIALSTPQDRALVTYLGAIATLQARELPAGLFRGQRHLHLTAWGLQLGLKHSFTDLMRKARRAGMTTSFDPNSDLSGMPGREVEAVIAESDIVLLNEPEAVQLSGEHDPLRALDRLAAVAPCVVVKLGRRGAVARVGRAYAAAPGVRVDTVDTTGAGDSFAAGFVSAFLDGLDLRACLQVGNACGALSTRCAGGTAGQADRRTLKRFLAEHPLPGGR